MGARAQEIMMAIPDLIQSAMASFRDGDTAQAAATCRAIIDVDPAHPEANHLLGVLCLLDGDPVAAESLIRVSLAGAEHEETEADLGLALKAQARHAEAEAAFRRALALNPDLTIAHLNLARVLEQQDHLEAAAKAFEDAIRLNPHAAQYHFELGKLYSRMNHPAEAREHFEHAVQIDPQWAEAHNSLGIAQIEFDERTLAEQSFRRAVELKPTLVVALVSLANVLKDTERAAEAEAFYRRALELDPHADNAAYNFTDVLLKLDRPDEAEAFSRQTLASNPRSVMNHFTLGNILMGRNIGNIGEALDCYRRAIEIDPGCEVAHSNLAFALIFHTDDGYELLRERQRYAAQFDAPFLSQPAPHYDNDRARGRRLRVGYVSPDFRDHCQSMFMLPLLRHHDHEVVEVFCYASIKEPDSVTKELAQFADVWRDVHKLSDEQLAQLVREDRIDVLMDLTMHMSTGRRQLFARRPAPVQIAWLAYPGTTGTAAIGYRLTDPWLDPRETRHLDDRYSEKSLRLPDTFWCYESLVKDVDVSPPPVLRNGYITFGCLNNPCKLTDRTFALWAQTMLRVDQSRLMLLAAPGGVRDRISEKFAALGIDPARIAFTGYRPRGEYLRAYGEIDIVLDIFPYNGHTTSLDALWMGVPVVSLTGTSPGSRAGYSLLSNLGLQELASGTEEGFIRAAIDLASDIPRLTALRGDLRPRMERSPLMDGARFARGVEDAYREAWREWCDEADQASH
jgi:protein O-GlcNAc transferase